MNRNTELHFGQTPKINQKRSKFNRSCSNTTTFNAGDCVPLYVDSDILPGDTVQMDMAELVRMGTPIYPIMDNLYMDIYWFFVPHRLVWDHWQAFWGENEDPWTQTTEYEIPQIEAPATTGWTEGTLADYMGIPTKVPGLSVNALPLRAYAKIWNDWFRDENLKTNCHIYKDETTRTGVNSGTYTTDVELGGKPAKAAKFHGYFTGALPEPQKGTPVSIPLGTTAPVYTYDDLTIKSVSTTPGTRANSVTPIIWYSTAQTGGKWSAKNYEPSTLTTDIEVPGIYVTGGGTALSQNTYLDATVMTGAKAYVTPANLMADLSTATAATINQLRTAFAIQKYYENAGLHGTRYIEYLKSVFGVTSSDARMQRAEYLGGQRVPLNIDQIIQTSSTDNTSPQGNTAGFSCTINRDSMFTKSFEEHGTLMCIGVVRTDRTYQQGLSKMWTRKKWTDFYNPFFANLGEMAILNENIYAQGNSTDKEAFGYQEAWAEYRYQENKVTGYMRSNATGSLDVWHFADNYNALPQLSGTWIDEPTANIDRTIAVTSQLTHQFIGNFFFKTYYTRCMPVYSVPGLIDHV